VVNRGLEVERSRYRDLFDKAPDVHFTTDRMGVIHDANIAARNILGVELDGLRGKPLTAFILTGYLPAFRRCLDELPRGRTVEVSLKMSNRRSTTWNVRFRATLTANPHQVLWVARAMVVSGSGEMPSVESSLASPSKPSWPPPPDDGPNSEGKRAIEALAN